MISIRGVHVPCRFADDLEIPHHRVDNLVIRAEFVKRQTGHVTPNFVNGLQDIFDA
jgi:hypothetical protein